MNFWLTTHWPYHVDENPNSSKTGVWVQDKKKSVLRNMQPEDLVFVYESGSGKTIVERDANGTERKRKKRKGRQGVIALAKVVKRPVEIEGSLPEKYADGSELWWRYKADARVLNNKGFIPRSELAQLLGYQPNYAFRGIGEKRSGVKILTKSEYDSIHTQFVKSQGDLKKKLKRRPVQGGPGGGEGPEHKSLKEYIAKDPEQALGEAGLRLLEMEYPFITGDRIDVLLQDINGRPVAVEVEVHCDETELAGPLQCMKYRSLIAYQLDWQVEQVRTILAAKSVAKPVKLKCNEYEIEVVEITE